MRRLLWITAIAICYANAFAQPDTLWTRMWGDDGSQCINAGLPLDNGSFLVGTDTTVTVVEIPYPPWFYERKEWCILMAQTDVNGDTLWTRRYLREDSADVHASAVCFASDSGYMVAGDIYLSGLHRDFYLAKVDTTGIVLWEQHYGNTRNEWCYSVSTALDGGYIMSGLRDSYPSGDEDSYIVKVDASGNLEWDGVYSTESEWWSQANVILSTPDSGFVFGGYFDYRGYMVKMNAAGDTLWSRFVPEAYEGGQVRCLMPAEDGGYIVGGRYMIVKVDSMGHTVWLRSLPQHSYNQYHEVWSMLQLPGGDIIAIGLEAILDQQLPDFWIARLTNAGDVLWDCAYPAWGTDVARFLQPTADGGYLLTGYTMQYPHIDRWDVRMVKTYADPSSAPGTRVVGPFSFTLSSYPNPFNSSTEIRFDLPTAGHVRLNVYDLTGREVALLKNEMMTTGSHTVEFDASSLPSGLYIYRLSTLGQSKAGKMVLLK